jgi:hypothetical protein
MAENDDDLLLEDVEETENVQKKPNIKVLKKKLVIKTQPAKPVIEEEEEEEEETPKYKPQPPRPARTEAQKLAFEKCKQKRDENAKKRLADAKKLAEYEKKALEEKLISKAISIKKKQIKKQVILDEISDDETPIEKVKEMAKKIKPVAPEKPKPSFTFI